MENLMKVFAAIIVILSIIAAVWEARKVSSSIADYLDEDDDLTIDDFVN